jgi:hypothetical protein
MKSIHRGRSSVYQKKSKKATSSQPSTSTTTLVIACCLALLTSSSDDTARLAYGFQPSIYQFTQGSRTRQHEQHFTEMKVFLDPTVAVDVASMNAVEVVHEDTFASDVTRNVRPDYPAVPSMISTMLASAAVVPAHGHSNPLFGPPDPYLQAGTSISPSARARSDLGLTASATTMTVQDIDPSLTSKVETAIKRGYKILDGRKIVQGKDVALLPGFAQTQSILAPQSNDQDSPSQFLFRIKLSEALGPLFDKLPFVAFYYVLVEFFILRPNTKDLYGEDIEEDPMGVAVETISDLGVRLGIFAILSLLVYFIS